MFATEIKDSERAGRKRKWEASPETEEFPKLLPLLFSTKIAPRFAGRDDSFRNGYYRRLLIATLSSLITPEETPDGPIKSVCNAMRLQNRPKVFWHAILSVLRRRSEPWTMGEVLKNWAAVSEKDIRTSDKAVKLPCAFRSDNEGQLNLEIDGSLLNPSDFEVLRHLMGPLVRVQSTPQGTVLDAQAENLGAKLDFDLSRDFGADTFDDFHTVIELEPVTVNWSNGLSGSISFVKSGSTPLVAKFTSSVVCPNLLRVLQERQASLILFDSNDPRTWVGLRTIHSSPDSRWTVEGQTVISDASMTGEIEPRGFSEDTVGSAEESEDYDDLTDSASSC